LTVVNPHDIDGMAAIIERAIAMPRAEQVRRMRSLRQRVRKRTVFTWAADFTQALTADQPQPVTSFPPATTLAGDRS
jgi:trehalose 6-phosphate synthase